MYKEIIDLYFQKITCNTSTHSAKSEEMVNDKSGGIIFTVQWKLYAGDSVNALTGWRKRV